jgi:polysaccharide biosynthesis protein PelC
MTRITHFLLLLVLVALSACSSTALQSGANTAALDARAAWVLLPIANNTETPQAALSAESMLEPLLRNRGIKTLRTYPAKLTRDTLFEPSERKVSEEAQSWAREQGARFGLTGSVEEWRYKVGIDGEPVVGVTLKVVDLESGLTVWSATAARSGWSRDALSAVAQRLLSDLLSGLPLANASP